MKYPVLIFTIVAAADLFCGASGGDTTKGKLKEIPSRIVETVTYDEVVVIPKYTNKIRWMLFKVTTMPDYYKYFKENENFCSVFHYGPDCGAIQFLKLPVQHEWGKAEVAIISYNEKTKDILRMYKSVAKADGTVATGTPKMTKLERVDRRNVVTEVTEIPDIVREKNEAQVSIVAVAPHGNWFILQDLDRTTTWVKVLLPAVNVVPSSDDAPAKDLRALLELERTKEQGENNVDWSAGDASTSKLDEMLNAYEKEVDQKLQELGIPLSTMKRVSLTFPFSPPPPPLP